MERPSNSDIYTVLLAISMPVMQVIETYATPGRSQNLPPMSYAMIIAALGALLKVSDERRKRLEAARGLPVTELPPAPKASS